MADRLGQAAQKELTGAGQEVSYSVEQRRIGRPIMDAMLTGFATAELEDVFEQVAAADVLIAATLAVNASFSGLFRASSTSYPS